LESRGTKDRSVSHTFVPSMSISINGNTYYFADRCRRHLNGRSSAKRQERHVGYSKGASVRRSSKMSELTRDTADWSGGRCHSFEFAKEIEATCTRNRKLGTNSWYDYMYTTSMSSASATASANATSLPCGGTLTCKGSAREKRYRKQLS
jgi:hypothetical protein